MAGRNHGRSNGTGYLIGTAIFGVLFTAAVLVQIRAKTFHPLLYWLTIVATTTVGITLADYCTHSLGIGYTGGSTILLICVMASPPDLALVDREHIDRNGEYTEDRGILLGHDHVLADARDGARRLGRRY